MLQEPEETMLDGMGNDELKVVKVPSRCTVKVHHLMCLELQRSIDSISSVFPAIESSRPRCQSGTEALCLLHITTDGAKSLIHLCSDSSKLYLAINAERILSRCIRIQNTAVSCLSLIQNMVPELLASKISAILHELRGATFFMVSKEHEAGKAIRVLFWKKEVATSHSRVSQELKALQTAALALKIFTPVALIIEKRSIQKLLDKFHDKDTAKNKVLRYLLHLLKKYGKSILQGQAESFLGQKGDSCNQYMKNGRTLESLKEDAALNEYSIAEIAGEFRCPISGKMMYDPVIIASGKSFERVCIEQWFNEGNRTCPVTNMMLDHLQIIPNTAIKDLISKWCLKRGISILPPPRHPHYQISFSTSIASFESSKDDLCIQISGISLGSSDSKSDSDILGSTMNHGVTLDNYESGGSLPLAKTKDARLANKSLANIKETELAFNSNFLLFSWGSRCDAMEDMKNKLKNMGKACELMPSPGLIDSIVTFLQDAQAFNDVKAQGDGLELILEILNGIRIDAQVIQEDAIYTIILFLHTEHSIQALEIMDILSSQNYFKSIALASNALPSILKVLNSPNRENHILALRILDNMSSQSDISNHLLYLDCMTKLIQLLIDPEVAKYCVRIIRDLCNTEGGKIAVSEADNHFSSILNMLETGTEKEQEHALDILVPLCYECAELCEVIKRESVIRALVNINLFGRYKAKTIAKEVLQILGYVKNDDNILPCPFPQKQIPGTQKDLSNHSKRKRFPGGIFQFLRWRNFLL